MDRFKATIALISLLLFPYLNTVQAETAEQRGLAIATEAERRLDGFHDFRADMTMVLKNAQGQVSEREIRIMSIEVNGDGDKSLSIFDQPADIKGTAMLTYTHKTGPDDQWLYLPALKRTKRISSRNKSGPFMGSEFAYEDIASQETEKYSYKFIKEDMFEGQECFVVERYPVDKNSGYTRQVAWIDKKEYRFLKVVYYDRKNSLLKTLTYSQYNKYLTNHWRAHDMFMENHQTKKTTLIKWRNFEFHTGLTDADFHKNVLKRVR